MKIGIDARLVGKGRGLGEFSLQLVRHLALLHNSDTYILFATRHDVSALRDLPDHFQVLQVPTVYPIAEQMWLPALIRQHRLDVFHATTNTAPLFLPQGTKLVLTVHDAIFMEPGVMSRSASWYQRLGRSYYRLVAPRAGRRSAAVLTVSEYSRQELARLCGWPLPSIEVIYEGVGEEFRPAVDEQIQKTLGRLGISQPYFLHLGAIDPRKQTRLVIEAFAKYGQRKSEGLVVSGLVGDQIEPFRSLAERLGVDERVYFPGFVSKPDLIDLYTGSQAFLFPSLAEGFGLPMLQAMACQVPVVAAKTTCLPEIGGDAAVYIDPGRVDELVRGMETVEQPTTRRKLIEAGRERVSLFDWRKTAQQYAAVYARLAQ